LFKPMPRPPRGRATPHAPASVRAGLRRAARTGRQCRGPYASGAGPGTKRPEPEAAGQVDLLQAVLKAIALREEIAPSLLAGASDLQELVDAKHQREKLDLPILQGWRKTLAGETLLEVLDGKLQVGIDPSTGTLHLTPKTSAKANVT